MTPLSQAITWLRYNLALILERTSANPKATAYASGIMIVVVLILITVLLLLLFKIESPHPPKEEMEEEKKKVSLRIRLIQIAITGFIAFLLLSVFFFYPTSQPYFCKSCHVMEREYQSWKTSSHRSVNCSACHQQPGILGFFKERMEMLRMIVLYFNRSYEKPTKALVDNESCLTCHRKVASRVIVNVDIRMSHKEPLAKGFSCLDCHSAITHRTFALQQKRAGMETCVTCHNGRQAKSDCKICHIKSTSKESRITLSRYSKAHLEEPTNCRGCHSIEPCTRCHGVEMPHPKGWKEKLHASSGAFEKKVACLKCHNDLKDCDRCHSTFPGHRGDWKQDHGLIGRQDEGISCRRCHYRSGDFCGLCH